MRVYCTGVKVCQWCGEAFFRKPKMRAVEWAYRKACGVQCGRSLTAESNRGVTRSWTKQPESKQPKPKKEKAPKPKKRKKTRAEKYFPGWNQPRELTLESIPAQMANSFWKYVKRDETSRCWEWQGRRDSCGYGRMGNYATHRMAYVLGTGKSIPKGKIILHECDNPPCCNPAHLQTGTFKDNYDDMVSKGRGGR